MSPFYCKYKACTELKNKLHKIQFNNCYSVLRGYTAIGPLSPMKETNYTLKVRISVHKALFKFNLNLLYIGEVRQKYTLL